MGQPIEVLYCNNTSHNNHIDPACPTIPPRRALNVTAAAKDWGATDTAPPPPPLTRTGEERHALNAKDRGGEEPCS